MANTLLISCQYMYFVIWDLIWLQVNVKFNEHVVDTNLVHVIRFWEVHKQKREGLNKK